MYISLIYVHNLFKDFFTYSTRVHKMHLCTIIIGNMLVYVWYYSV